MFAYLVQFLLSSIHYCLGRGKLVSHGGEWQVSGGREGGNVDGSWREEEQRNDVYLDLIELLGS